MDLGYLYQDAVFVIETGEYHRGTKVYRAARKVLLACGEKQCSKCNEIQSVNNFYTSSSKFTPDGLQSNCKMCNTISVREWRNSDLDSFNKRRREKWHAMMDSLPDFMQRQQTLYRLFDENDRLLYVGIAWNVRNRFYNHKADKVWWGDVARHELEEYPDRDSVLKAEMLAIKTEFPIYNVLHA